MFRKLIPLCAALAWIVISREMPVHAGPFSPDSWNAGAFDVAPEATAPVATAAKPMTQADIDKAIADGIAKGVKAAQAAAGPEIARKALGRKAVNAPTNPQGLSSALSSTQGACNGGQCGRSR